MFDNIMLLTDGYKVSHHKQYPKDTEIVYSYLESRGGLIAKAYKPEGTLFFGLQYFLKRHLEGQVVTQEKIDRATKFYSAYFGRDDVFNREGWQYILDAHDGYLPVKIKAVEEGSIVPQQNVLLTIENTDPKCSWLTNFLETVLLQLW